MICQKPLQPPPRLTKTAHADERQPTILIAVTRPEQRLVSRPRALATSASHLDEGHGPPITCAAAGCPRPFFAKGWQLWKNKPALSIWTGTRRGSPHDFTNWLPRPFHDIRVGRESVSQPRGFHSLAVAVDEYLGENDGCSIDEVVDHLPDADLITVEKVVDREDDVFAKFGLRMLLVGAPCSIDQRSTSALSITSQHNKTTASLTRAWSSTRTEPQRNYLRGPCRCYSSTSATSCPPVHQSRHIWRQRRPKASSPGLHSGQRK